MSCRGNEFANLKNSWNKNSDLTPSGFDPYPELQRTENYCCDGRYNNLKSIHKQKQHITTNSVMLENYPKTLPWNNPSNYDLLEQTWNPQKPYKL